MKKIFFFLAFVGLITFSANAQKTSCSKSTKSNTKVEAQDMDAAIYLASMDETIEKRVCEKSGKESFVRKDVCAKSGKVSYSDVEYCSKSKAFVNVAPQKSCCASKKTGASKVSSEAKKPCCAKGASKTTCSKNTKASCSKTKSKVKVSDEVEMTPSHSKESSKAVKVNN